LWKLFLSFGRGKGGEKREPYLALKGKGASSLLCGAGGGKKRKSTVSGGEEGRGQ